jgi:hypothetical protein
MGKFLAIWEVDTTRVPDKPEDRYKNWIMMLNMVKKDMESGVKDWGMFAGRLAGYSITEGSEQEIALRLTKYVPYIKFKVYPVISVDQVLENITTLSKI